MMRCRVRITRAGSTQRAAMWALAASVFAAGSAKAADPVPASAPATAGTPAPGASAAPSTAPAPANPGAPPTTTSTPQGSYTVRLHDLERRVDELKEQIFRSKARLNLLKETVLHGVIAGSRAIIT